MAIEVIAVALAVLVIAGMVIAPAWNLIRFLNLPAIRRRHPLDTDLVVDGDGCRGRCDNHCGAVAMPCHRAGGFRTA